MTPASMTHHEESRAGTPARAVVVFIIPLLLSGILPEFSWSQGMPPRGNTLMRIHRLNPPPVSGVELLRREILNSINPVSGTISVRQLRRQYSTRPEIPIEQNAVTTQYQTQPSTRPGVKPDQDVGVTTSQTQTSTRDSGAQVTQSSVQTSTRGAVPIPRSSTVTQQSQGQSSTRKSEPTRSNTRIRQFPMQPSTR